MARPVKIYRWDDVGAPQRSPSNASEIVNILKKCLVDGYDAKAPLGWTLEYEDAPNAVAVFRNSPINGSGGVFRITPYNTPSAAYIITQSAQAATGAGISDLFNPGYRNSIPTDANFTRWILVGDDVSFYLILHHATQDFATTTPEVCIFCGDFTPVIPTDTAVFICTGANSNSTSAGLTVGTSSINMGPLSASSGRNSLINAVISGDSVRSRLGIPTTVSGAAQYNNYALFIAGEAGDTHPSTAVTSTGYPAGAMIHPVAIKLESVVGVTNVFDTEVPFIRGYMPGLISPLYKTHQNATWPVTKDLDGKIYLGLAMSTATAANGGIRLWLNIEDWD